MYKSHLQHKPKEYREALRREGVYSYVHLLQGEECRIQKQEAHSLELNASHRCNNGFLTLGSMTSFILVPRRFVEQCSSLPSLRVLVWKSGGLFLIQHPEPGIRPSILTTPSPLRNLPTGILGSVTWKALFHEECRVSVHTTNYFAKVLSRRGSGTSNLNVFAVAGLIVLQKAAQV